MNTFIDSDKPSPTGGPEDRFGPTKSNLFVDLLAPWGKSSIRWRRFGKVIQCKC